MSAAATSHHECNDAAHCSLPRRTSNVLQQTWSLMATATGRNHRTCTSSYDASRDTPSRRYGSRSLSRGNTCSMRQQSVSAQVCNDAGQQPEPCNKQHNTCLASRHIPHVAYFHSRPNNTANSKLLVRQLRPPAPQLAAAGSPAGPSSRCPRMRAPHRRCARAAAAAAAPPGRRRACRRWNECREV